MGPFCQAHRWADMSKIKADTAKLAELAGRKGEQLGAFLALLSPDVALQLATALERDRIAGGTGLPVDAILTGLRPRLRELPADVRRRIPTPQRLFFEVVDGMITDTAGDKSAGRIARRSLDPIWRWLLAADARLTALRDELAHQVLIGDPALVPDALKAFDAIAGETIRAGVKKAESKEKTAKEVIQSVGGQRAFEDMRELGRVLQISDEIRGLRTSLPPAVDEEDEGHLSLIRRRSSDVSRNRLPARPIWSCRWHRASSILWELSVSPPSSCGPTTISNSRQASWHWSASGSWKAWKVRQPRSRRSMRQTSAPNARRNPKTICTAAKRNDARSRYAQRTALGANGF